MTQRGLFRVGHLCRSSGPDGFDGGRSDTYRSAVVVEASAETYTESPRTAPYPPGKAAYSASSPLRLPCFC